jgi:hypothetical protein
VFVTAKLYAKKNIFSPLQVKNKPHDTKSEHAFILGSMDCTVANNCLIASSGKQWCLNVN